MGAPLVWKTPHAERQLSGSEEMVSLQLCPFRLWSLLFLRILHLGKGHAPMPPAAAQGRGWARLGGVRGAERKRVGSGQLSGQRRTPHQPGGQE